MCGICGEIRFGASAPVARDTLRAMRDRLVHRGPDSDGLFVSSDGRAGLGFRRLRIIDLSPNASQPLGNEDGSVQLVFNGEIYNFMDLRPGLEQRGHRFRSRSDSEVIVHLYEERGIECIADLDGMFALAIWDAREQRVVLARDRAGKKPLFYYADRDRLVFASEIKAFFGHPAVPIEPDPSALPYYFIHGYVPSPQTFYRGVRHVEPGSLLVVNADGTTESRTYWQLEFPPEAETRQASRPPRAEVVGRVRELMTRAVERRLVSDVPIGAFLSGGVDSTIVVGLMSRLLKEPVRTFSIGFEGDPQYDETEFARLVARRFGTEHTEFRVKPSAIDLIEKLVWHHDGPFGDASAVPTYIVSQLTRHHVTVVLTGDGGDELFAGYQRFAATVTAERVPVPLRKALQALAAGIPRSSHERNWLARGRRFVQAMGLPIYERMTRWSSLFYDDLETLFTPEFLRSVQPIDRLHYLRRDLPQLDPLSPLGKALYVNYRSYLLDDLLVKLDRCSMANSLEARSPFLDRALTEYAATLPDDMKLSGWSTKIVLREAFADLLPPSVASRAKMGFGVPLGAWFRTELRDYVRDLLLSPDAKYTPYLSRDRVSALVQAHQEGRAHLGLQLWSLACFEVWLRQLPEWRRGTTETWSASWDGEESRTQLARAGELTP